jgi:hypothetical protein
VNVALLFVILAAVCGAYYIYSCWWYPAGAVHVVRREGTAGSAAAEAVRPVRPLRRQGMAPAAGHPNDRKGKR